MGKTKNCSYNHNMVRSEAINIKAMMKTKVLKYSNLELTFKACVPVVNNGCSGKFYITAAFRCSFGNQAYDLTTLDGEVIDGPKRIFPGIPSLEATVFGDYGIYYAFGLHHRNEAFIFSGKWCALIGYARDGSDFKILKGPTLIDIMFPLLIGTAFENHVGAAFESATDNEAYLFRGIEYAVINYADGCLISDKQTFDCLRDTIFEGGFDAAFASHVPGEAFIFKDDSYALINFVDRCIIGGVKKVIDDVGVSWRGQDQQRWDIVVPISDGERTHVTPRVLWTIESQVNELVGRDELPELNNSCTTIV